MSIKSKSYPMFHNGGYKATLRLVQQSNGQWSGVMASEFEVAGPKVAPFCVVTENDAIAYFRGYFWEILE